MLIRYAPKQCVFPPPQFGQLTLLLPLPLETHALESVFINWPATGEEVYRDLCGCTTTCWQENLSKTCKGKKKKKTISEHKTGQRERCILDIFEETKIVREKIDGKN